MDIVYLIAACALWVATVGLAVGCEGLRQHKVSP